MGRTIVDMNVGPVMLAITTGHQLMVTHLQLTGNSGTR